MNVENLRNKYPQLIEFMSTAGYSRNYVQVVRQVVKFILSPDQQWESYDEILDYYEKIAISKKDSSKKKAILNLIASFDYSGIFPGERDKVTYFQKSISYDYLTPEFKSLVDYYYYSNVDRKLKKETTILNECWNTSSFLLSIQKVGCHSLTEVVEDDVLSVFTDDSGYPTKSASYAKQVIAVFKSVAECNPECRRILLYIPAIRKHRKNIQYLTLDERAKVKSALKNTGNKLSYRNRAIGYLLYFTGLRRCDIFNLTFSDIDWDKDEISIRQQKTNEPLTLPMSAIVGNAIYDYMTEERKKSDSPYIFLSCSYPYSKLKPQSMSNIADQIYKNAEIRQNPNDRRGGHLFRHNFATIMLENDVSRAVISKALGQTSPASAEDYLSADMVHLKECSLSIEAFPVRKGVFCSEQL